MCCRYSIQIDRNFHFYRMHTLRFTARASTQRPNSWVGIKQAGALISCFSLPCFEKVSELFAYGCIEIHVWGMIGVVSLENMVKAIVLAFVFGREERGVE